MSKFLNYLRQTFYDVKSQGKYNFPVRGATLCFHMLVESFRLDFTNYLQLFFYSLTQITEHTFCIWSSQLKYLISCIIYLLMALAIYYYLLLYLEAAEITPAAYYVRPEFDSFSSNCFTPRHTRITSYLTSLCLRCSPRPSWPETGPTPGESGEV